MQCLLVLFLGLLISTGASWYEQASNGQAWPPAAGGAGMPAIQRSDVLVQGQHPTLLLIAPFVAGGNSSAGTLLAVDLPMWRVWNGTGPAPGGGRANFFLWDAKAPPQGSNLVLMNNVKETWIDATSNAGWPVTQPNGINIYRFVHNMTNAGLLVPGGLFFLGLFVEQTNYTGGLLDWVALPMPENASDVTTSPFSYLDRYGSFLIANTTLSKPQMIVTVAPKATALYTTPANTSVVSLAMRAWTWCADDGGIAALPSTTLPSPSPSPVAPVTPDPSPSPSSMAPVPGTLASPPPPIPVSPSPQPIPGTPSPPLPIPATPSPPPQVSPPFIVVGATPSRWAVTPPANGSTPAPVESKVEANALLLGLTVGSAVLVVLLLSLIVGCYYMVRLRGRQLSLDAFYRVPSPRRDADAISLEDLPDDDDGEADYTDMELPATVGLEEIQAAMATSSPAARRAPAANMPASLIALGATPRTATVDVPLTSPDLTGGQ